MIDMMLVGIVTVVLIACGAAMTLRTPSSFLFDLIGRFSSHAFPARRR